MDKLSARVYEVNERNWKRAEKMTLKHARERARQELMAALKKYLRTWFRV